MKKNSAAAKKYAKALFLLAAEEGVADKIGDSLDMLIPLNKKDLSDFFLNPFVDDKIKSDVIKTIFPKLPEKVFNLLFLLIKKNETRLIPEISEKYNQLVLDSKNLVRAKVISAEKLESNQSEKIKIIMEKITRKGILMNEETDGSVIGGTIIKIGDLVIDGSIKGRINLIARELLK